MDGLESGNLPTRQELAEAQKEQEKEAEERRKEFLAHVRTCFGSQAGNNVFMDLIDFCGVFRSGNTDAKDGNRIAYENGMREVGLYLLGILEDADPFMFPNMQIRRLKVADKKNQK